MNALTSKLQRKIAQTTHLAWDSTRGERTLSRSVPVVALARRCIFPSSSCRRTEVFLRARNSTCRALDAENLSCALQGSEG